MLAVSAFVSDAGAQGVATRQLEIAGGHQLSQSFRARNLEEWFVSVAGSLNERMALVGEVAGTSLRRVGRGQTFLVGLRYAWSGRRVTPFVQGLVGGASLQQTFDPYGFNERAVEVESLFGGYQIGGGVDFRITRRIAARLAANSLILYSDRLKHLQESGRTSRFRFAAGAVLRVPPAPHAMAFQGPYLELAGGYQGLTALRRLPFPRGWLVSVGRPLNERVTVVGEVADAFYRDVTPGVFIDEQHWYTYLAGVRYGWPGQRVVPFVQVLGGGGAITTRETALYEDPRHENAYGYRFLAHQLTGGIDILIMKRLAARLAVNSLTFYADGVGVNVLRFSTGIALGVGSR